MIRHTIPIIAAAVLLALVSCAGTRSGFPKVDQQGKTAIVAHRGFWKCEEAGFAENSIASLKAAQDHGFWGSEFDVHITTDDVVLVYHDDHVEGVRIDTAPYAAFRNHRLANGEPIPTLDDYLEQGTRSEETVLVLELKIECTPEREDALLDRCIASLEAHGLLDPRRVVFISFSKYICDRIAREYPAFINQYLEGDFSPEQLAADGINGFDYQDRILKENGDFIARAHGLGMSTNSWTVNDSATMKQFIDLGIDALTTNEPLVLRELLADKEFRLTKSVGAGD